MGVWSTAQLRGSQTRHETPRRRSQSRRDALLYAYPSILLHTWATAWVCSC